MAKDESITIEESVALREIFKQYVEKHIKQYKPIYYNMDRFIFLKDPKQKRSLMIFGVDHASEDSDHAPFFRFVRLMLPKIRYIIVGGSAFNDLGFNEKERSVCHILEHIPPSLSGYLKEHDGEFFVGESKLFSQDNRLYEVAGEWEDRGDGTQRPKPGYEIKDKEKEF